MLKKTHHPSLDDFAADKLRALEAADLRRALAVTEPLGAIQVRRDGRTLISFCSNDYLNLAHHPAVIDAAVEATREFGAGAGASRLVTGNHPLYLELEARLARLKGAEAAIVLGSGYLANTGIIPALLDGGDAVFIDALSHSCLFTGARLTRGGEFIFRHNDIGDLGELLARHRDRYRHALILTDGVFSMDGDRAPVAELAGLADEFDAWLMIDDAHGIGVIGGGRGSGFDGGGRVAIDLQMGTLSKAVGAHGGYLAASRAVIDLIGSRCRTLFYSTALPPGIIAAAIAGLKIIESDPGLVARPVQKARAFTNALGLPAAQSAIVPVVIGGAGETLAAAAALEDEGFLITAIRPPTVPENTSRLRLTFSAGHDDGDIQRLAGIILDKILKRGR